MPEKYGPAEQAALIVLALENREVPNTQLTKGRGIDLGESGRKRLNKDGLIKTRKEKGRLYHQITEEGIAWCEEELATIEAPPRSGPLPRAAFEALRLILRHGGVYLENVLRGAALESRIRTEYRALLTKPRDWVKLADLRARLDESDKDVVDRVLLAMNKTRDVHLAPDSDRRTLTDSDQAAALRIGSEVKHQMLIEES